MVFAILQMTFVSLVTISAEFMTIPASAETTFGGSCRKARASAPFDTSIRVVRYEPVNVVTALAVMHFTLLGIMVGTVSALAGRVGALSKNFSGMVGASNVVAVMVSALAGRVGALSRNFCGMVVASCVVVRTIGALAVRASAQAGRVGALAVRVGAQAGAISVVLGLV